MRDRLSDFGPDTDVVLVTFTSRELALHYSDRLELPFPLLIDEDRSVYHSYSLGRGSVARVWGWRAAKRYFEIFRNEGVRGLRLPTEDTLQLGGDFVIAPDGDLAYRFQGQGPDDRPSIDELVQAVDRTRR